jgi:hypothetical protein
MTALVHRVPDCGFGRLDDPGNESLDLQGILRAKTIRATVASKDGKRAADLLSADR